MTLITETSEELQAPVLRLISIAPPAAVGVESMVTIGVTNPFSAKQLTGITLQAEGRRLTDGVVSKRIPDVVKGGDTTIEIPVTPRLRGRRSLSEHALYQLSANLSANEIQGIAGRFSIRYVSPVAVD